MIAVAFIVGGIVMLIVERFRPAPDVFDVDGLPISRALAIGSFQALALIPGVSRSGGTIVAAMAMRVDRAAAAEFTFFLAMPTMAAAFAHNLLEVRHHLGRERGLEIAVGFVMAFIASALVVKPFLSYVQTIRLRAVRVVSDRGRRGAARGARRRVDVSDMHWLRRSFIAGFFVVVPLFISVAAFIWVFGVVDGLTGPLYDRVLGRRIPGLGTLTTVAAIVLVGAFARNVIGRRVLQRGESWLLRVPGFRTIYAPVKQLIVAFSPDNESGFKRVVMVEDGKRGFVLGFLTREFTIDRGRGPEALLAVYVPTNHLYLGDIVIVDPAHATFPDITVEDGIRIFLTGGMALPTRLRI